MMDAVTIRWAVKELRTIAAEMAADAREDGSDLAVAERRWLRAGRLKAIAEALTD